MEREEIVPYCKVDDLMAYNLILMHAAYKSKMMHENIYTYVLYIIEDRNAASN